MTTCTEAAERRRMVAGRKAGIRLTKAAEALSKYISACRECGEALHLDDDRRLTLERVRDLGSHPTSLFGEDDPAHGSLAS